METKRLKNWEKELNICIRCGYCYEHCHLFKVFNWEIDTPRGKMLMLYGLLTHKIEPSPYIAEKIFECFYCKNCEKSCSAKVPVTDILTDARADLLEAGFDVEGTTARVNEYLCSGCRLCVSVCQTKAISIKEYKEGTIAVVDKTKCKGCGVCASTCPAEAISLKEGFGITKKELLENIESCFVM